VGANAVGANAVGANAVGANAVGANAAGAGAAGAGPSAAEQEQQDLLEAESLGYFRPHTLTGLEIMTHNTLAT
jgi:hypothetical protein